MMWMVCVKSKNMIKLSSALHISENASLFWIVKYQLQVNLTKLQWSLIKTFYNVPWYTMLK